MHLRLCICDLIQPLTLATRVVVLAHFHDERKPTNTSRLVSLMLTNAEVRLRGLQGRPLETSDLIDPDRLSLLLYPAPDAVPLCRADIEAGRPVTLIVPDGSWRHARRMRGRVPGLADLRCVQLSPGPPSRYRLRAQADPRRVSTFEAVARALGELEGAAVRAHLEDVFEVMVERTLWIRGRLFAENVAGGIPPAHEPT